MLELIKLLQKYIVAQYFLNKMRNKFIYIENFTKSFVTIEQMIMEIVIQNVRVSTRLDKYGKHFSQIKAEFKSNSFLNQ